MSCIVTEIGVTFAETPYNVSQKQSHKVFAPIKRQMVQKKRKYPETWKQLASSAHSESERETSITVHNLTCGKRDKIPCEKVKAWDATLKRNDI